MVERISIANLIGAIIVIAGSVTGIIYWYFYGFKFEDGMGYLTFHLSLDPYFFLIGMLGIGIAVLYSSLRRIIR